MLRYVPESLVLSKNIYPVLIRNLTVLRKLHICPDYLSTNHLSLIFLTDTDSKRSYSITKARKTEPESPQN